ncbi:MAG: AAA family ATPase [Chloroflexota bacterium]|nr:AAA family ATPase [Chloroflexota bacterium]
MSEFDQVKTSLAALEAQRHVLGNAVADQAIEALRKRLAELEQKSRVPDEGERKHITVMFADLSGFTRLSEMGDAEEIRGWLNACFAELAAVVRRYGGYIDKFIGDELMVLFGAPQAMEDHAARALHAALDMRIALERFNQAGATRPEVSMHFGINSGTVIAGAMGVEDRREYTVMGDAVNVAARLASRAESGQILIAADTRRLAGDDFILNEMGSTTVKGREGPVEVFQLIDRRPDVPGLDEPLAGSAMIGRDREMRVLRDVFDDVSSKQHACSVSIVGLAGIGKSRLMREFVNWIEDTHQGTTLIIGEALPHMQMTPYYMIGSAIRSALEVRDGEPAEAIRERLGAALAGVNVTDAEHLRALEAILGVEEALTDSNAVQPEDLKKRIFAAAAEAIRALAPPSNGAIIVAFEDLHWADDLSVELLEHVFATLLLAPVLFLTTQRPIDDEESAVLRFQSRLPQGRHTRMVLSELDASASQSLVRAMAPGIERSAHGLDVIVRKSQGNPFFMQSIVAALQDRGIPLDSNDGVGLAQAIESADVPDTVWDVLADRIDRLPVEGKRVVQMASIAGRTFWEGLVQELTGLPASRHLQTLTQRELVDRVGRAAFADEWEWTFRHILVQEVAYSGLLRETRRAGHLAAAEWLERRVGDRLTEYATLLAYHYQKAEDWAKTAQFAEAAGDRAVALFAHREAKDAYLQALDSLRSLTEDEDTRRRQIDVALKLADVTYYMPIEEVRVRLQRAQQLAEVLGDPERKLRVDNALASWLYVAGEMGPAVALAQRSVATADPSQERLLEVPLRILGRAALALGSYEVCVNLLERAEAVAPLSGTPSRANSQGRTLGILGIGYALKGDMPKGESLALEALHMAEAAHDVRQIAASHMYLGLLLVAAGKATPVAGEHLEEAVRVSDEIGDPTLTSYSLGYLGNYHGLRGNLTEAANCLDRCLQIVSGLDTVLFVSLFEAYRAEVDVRAGQFDLALPRAERALALGQASGQKSAEAEASRVLGWALHFAKPEARTEAEKSFVEAVEIHKRCHGMTNCARTLTDFAAYLRLVGETERAARVQAEADSLIQQFGFDWMPVAPPLPVR